MKRFDIVSYLLLSLGLVIAIARFFAVWANPTAQFLTIAGLVAYYLIWGFSYHYLKKDLKRKLFLEYLLVGAIGIVVGVLVFLT